MDKRVGRRRLTITFTEPQWKWLKLRAKERGLTVAEVIRELADAAYKSEQK